MTLDNTKCLHESANPNGSFFTINGQTGNIYVNSRVDREQYPQHELVVVGIDEGSPSLTGSTIVSITITDINDNPPEFTQSQFYGTVTENAATGTPVMNLANRQLQLLAIDNDRCWGKCRIYLSDGNSIRICSK